MSRIICFSLSPVFSAADAIIGIIGITSLSRSNLLFCSIPSCFSLLLLLFCFITGDGEEEVRNADEVVDSIEEEEEEEEEDEDEEEGA